MTFLLRQISSFSAIRSTTEQNWMGRHWPVKFKLSEEWQFHIISIRYKQISAEKKKESPLPPLPPLPSFPWLINSPSNRVRANKQYHRSRFAFASSLTGILYRGTNDVCLPTIDRTQHRAPRFINNIAPQLARLNNRAL